MARVYPSGEVSVSIRTRNSASKHPKPHYGVRLTRGISRSGARKVRRACVARARLPGRHHFVLLTLTSQALRSDREMRRYLKKFLDVGRGLAPEWFGWYVCAVEDQARGVLHFHIGVDGRVSREVYMQLRNLWCVTYGMGGGAFDTEVLRGGGKALASYLSKYLTKRTTCELEVPSADGSVQLVEWPVSRHTGEVHVRDRYQGNSYSMSDSARYATRPVTTVEAAYGAFPGLGSGPAVHHYADSLDDAHAWLSAALATGPPVDDAPHG